MTPVTTWGRAQTSTGGEHPDTGGDTGEDTGGRAARRPGHRRGTAVGALVCMLALGLAACGGEQTDTEGGGGGEVKIGDAAEPADSPEVTQAPAGTVETVEPKPQGIAYDPATDSLVVGVHNSFRMLVLDPETFEVRMEVPLPGQVRHLQVTPDGGTALVPIEPADAVYEVNLRTGEVRETDVENFPHDATGAPNGDVLVGNEFSGSVSVVREGEVVHTFDDLNQPGSVQALGDIGIAVDVGEWTITTYDLTRLERIERLPAGEGPTHGALVGDGKVAVADTRGDQILVYTVDPLEQVASVDLPGAPYGIAGDPQSQTLWVTLTETNELVGYDVSGDTPREIERYPTVRQPDTVAVSPGAQTLWVTGTANGEIQRIER